MLSFDRSIEPPARASGAGTAVILAVAVLFSIIPFGPGFGAWAAFACGLLVLGALLGRQIHAFLPAFLAFLITALPLLHPVFSRWPWRLLVPVLFSLAMVLSVPRLRPSLLWMRPGRIDRDSLLIAIVIACGSAVALVLWQRLTLPDLAMHLRSFPAMPLWLFPLAGLGFSLGNAAVEEFVFRGVYLQAFDSVLGAGWASVLLQAWLFGAMHYLQGFPNGLPGVLLAGLYGLLLGILRRRTRGMAAPWLTHAAADLVIFVILALQLAGKGSGS
ncbi:MAG: hypothetical protein A2078_10070 [Nitrospirae bacterium GWC2_57_9]|nr:MAG: hypothetical protein A2078_10070 [Nitrospirae bacterium GWC2_57_9]